MNTSENLNLQNKKITVDTCVVIDGRISELIKKDAIKNSKIIIPEAVVSELEAQANKGREIGYLGIEELTRLVDIAKKHNIEIEYYGERPSIDTVSLAKSGEIDAMIRKVAKETNSILLTSDRIQYNLAKAQGIESYYLEVKEEKVELYLMKYFDDITSSIHLKENCVPYAKKGKPGEVKLVPIGDEKLTKEKMEYIIDNTLKYTEQNNGFIEIQKRGATVIQLKNLRISIARPPFSEGLEITVVRPITKVSLDNYKLSDKLLERLREKAEGIFVSGSPGSGKCLPKETEVLLPNGTFEKIENLNIGDYVLSVGVDGIKENPIINTFKRKERKLIKIRTKTGREMTLTPNHPIMCINNDGLVNWKDVKSLEVGNTIGTLKNISIDEKNVKDTNTIYIPDIIKELDEYHQFYAILENGDEVLLSEISKCKCDNKNLENIKYIFYKGTNNIKSRKIKPYIIADENFYELLGLLYAEGSGGIVEFNNYDEGLMNHCINLFKKVFELGDDDLYFASKGKLRVRKSKTIYLVLKALGYPEKEKSRTLKIPEIVLKSNDKHISAFIRGVFEGDGYIGKSGIEISSASGYFAKDMYYLLIRLGITPSLKKKIINEWTYYRLLIQNSEDIIKFYNTIHPKYKTNGFELFTNKIKNPNIGTVPVGNLLKNLYGLFGESLPHSTKNEYSMERLSYHFDILIDKYRNYLIYKEDIENLKKLNDKLKEWKTIVKKMDEVLNTINKNEFCRKHHIDHCSFRLYLEDKRNPSLKTFIKYLEVFNKNFDFKKELSEYVLIESEIYNILIKIKPIIYGNGFGVINDEMARLMIDKRIMPNINKLSEYICNLTTFYFEKQDLIETCLSNIVAILNKNILWDKIIEIEELDYDGYVYDIEVPNHNFIINKTPVLVHNSTFVSALAEFYCKNNKIVKTMESPRDLQVGKMITQYAPLEGNMENTCDILLLVRPDYTIYDEVRKTRDFEIFADMRMAGVGMVGVVHASKPIDAIQRLIGRVELGIIPQIVDTIIYIENGQIKKVYEVHFTVKVPHGMKEADLARPVIEVRDFETEEVEYEIYTYGEQVVVMPIGEEEVGKSKPSIYKYAEDRITEILGRHLPKKTRKEMKVKVKDNNTIDLIVPEKYVPAIIGKGGKEISKLEDMLGLRINVVRGHANIDKHGDEAEKFERYEFITDYETTKLTETKNHIVVDVGEESIGANVKVYVDGEYLCNATVSSNGTFKINKKSGIGKELLNAMKKGKDIYVEID